MTWVRYDDRVRDHAKVRGLDDATYRLWREAIEWSSASQTDGVILREDLPLTSRRASPARAAKLVTAKLWHPAGETCGHERCPPSTPDGWVIHDFWDYNPTAAEVRIEQEKARERQRNWRAKKRGHAASNGVTDAVADPVTDGVTNAVNNGYPAPPRPAPTPTGWVGPTAPSAGPPPEADGAAAAGEVDLSSVAAELDAANRRGIAAVRAALNPPAEELTA